MMFLIKLLPYCLFVLGLLWVLVFPLLNVTSGELKPRGIYVDEHALLVHSELYKKLELDNTAQNAITNQTITNAGFICEYFSTQHNILCSTPSHMMAEIVVEPWTSKIVLDATVLVVPYEFREDCSVQSAFQFVNDLVGNIAEVDWLAKRVVILMLPSGGAQSISNKLKKWLSKHHKPTQIELSRVANDLIAKNMSPQIGLIREAYVLDFFSHAQCSVDDNKIQFTKLAIHHSGRNGLQPNMDMIAYPLAVHTGMLQAHSQQCSEAATNKIDSWLRNLRDWRQMSHFVAPVAHGVQFLRYMWEEINEDKTLLTYRSRLLGLLCSMYAHIVPDSHSLHADLLEYNIDAVTLRISNENAKISKERLSVSNRKLYRNGGTNNMRFSLDKAVEVALSFVYMSNNLHEELHHSHFYYLLMGSDTFVGISEYGFTAGIFLLSVLTLFHLLCAERRGVSYNEIFPMFLTTLFELLPVVAYLLISYYQRFGDGTGSGGDTIQCNGADMDFHANSCAQLSGTGFISPHQYHDIILLVCSALPLYFIHKSANCGTSIVSKMVTYPLIVLISVSCIFAHNFSLGLLVAISIIPTIITATIHGIYCPYNNTRSLLLLCLSCIHSHAGLLILNAVLFPPSGRIDSFLDTIQAVFVQDHVLSYPAIIILNSLTSYYCLLCWIALKESKK